MIRITITTSDEPTVKEALTATPAEVKLWHEAIEAELKTLEDKRTWIEVKDKPINTNALPSHIVHKIKRNKHGQPKVFKARVVDGGHRQLYQRDYKKIYSPVVDFRVCLLVWLIDLVMGLCTRHVDVKAAFVNGDNDRVWYIMFPYNVPNKKKRKMYVLHKSLYGLKQAPLPGSQNFLINEMKYKQLKTDWSVFIKNGSNGEIQIILTYVDDLIFVSSSTAKHKQEVACFLDQFEGTEEALEWYLGVHICFKEAKLVISQSA